MPTLDLAALNAAIPHTEFAGHLHHLPTVDSTQTLAHAAARSGARQGVWIADQQTAGRGRGAHAWHSPFGPEGEPAGLYMTALASPPIPMQSTLGLSFRTAIAVQAAIAELTGLTVPHQIDIRWPNDLLLHGRKTGGILIELAPHPLPASGPALLRYAVFGIGINLNGLTFPPELDPIATSLRRELPGHPILPREPLAAAILRNLDAQLQNLATSYLKPQTENLSSYSTWLTGKPVRVEPRYDAPGYTGTTAGLTQDGFLLVRGDDGQLHTVLSGGLREP
ncbi:MAG: biotin--[acetyl-CoA-carboxylase] ligase [Acidobacteriota bacterium]|nr:biotin--[acetyl-CoA-carboxylase] ligase [Acidobacteriota bacterium]